MDQTQGFGDMKAFFFSPTSTSGNVSDTTWQFGAPLLYLTEF
jgi:hypothetical protein